MSTLGEFTGPDSGRRSLNGPETRRIAPGRGGDLAGISDFFNREQEAQESLNDGTTTPDGGYRAWLQVLGAFMLFFNTWGIINSYGAYQTFYEEEILSSWNASTISWIGSIQSFLVMFIGAATGPLYDAGYFRALIVTGSFLIVFGYLMLSLCTEYWQVMLAQGICISLGSGAIFVPGVAILSTYFKNNLSLAVGLSASGSSIGGVIYPITFRALQQHIGFGWACRVTGFIALLGLLIANAAMKVRLLPVARRSVIDWSAMNDVPYILFSVGIFLAFIGLYTPYYYVQDFAIRQQITGSNLGLHLLAVLNAASTFGRIVPNFLADKLGAFNIMVPCSAISGVLILCLVAIENAASLLAWCIFFGFFSGSFVSLMPSVLIALAPRRGVVGTRMGMCSTFTAIGLLVGAPAAGAILHADRFTQVWIYGGTFTIVGALSILLARNSYCRWKALVKV